MPDLSADSWSKILYILLKEACRVAWKKADEGKTFLSVCSLFLLLISVLLPPAFILLFA